MLQDFVHRQHQPIVVPECTVGVSLSLGCPEHRTTGRSLVGSPKARLVSRMKADSCDWPKAGREAEGLRKDTGRKVVVSATAD